MSDMSQTLHSRTPAGWKRRSLLAPGAAPGDVATALLSVSIIENAPGAVMLEATFRTEAGKSVIGRFRLTTGMAIVEFRPGRGTGRLLVRDRIRHVVAPDLFYHDFVVSPAGAKHDRVGIPAENMLLGFLGDREAIGMCVWRSVEQNADAIVAGAGKQRAIRACQIECGKDRPLWYALLEAKGIWHVREIADGDIGKRTPLAWAPPFPAKWRGGFVWPDSGGAWSQAFDDAGPGAPAEGSRWRRLSSGRGHRWVAVKPGSEADTEPPPAFVFESGRPVVAPAAWLSKGGAPSGSSSDPPTPRRLIAYPLDRSRLTPLNVYCPIDIMRNTLGVGVCQYVLDTEGLANGTTPGQVGNRLERIFRKKRDKQQAEEIKQGLAAMVRHARRMDARIVGYIAAARRLAKLCEARKNEPPEACSRAADQLERTLSNMVVMQSFERTWFADPAAEKSPSSEVRTVEDLSRRIAELIATPNAAANALRLTSALPRIEAVQDRHLAMGRRAFREVKQQCRTIEACEPGAASFAAMIRREVEKVLRKKPQADE